MIRLTKKQKTGIYEQFPGTGEIAINLGMNRMVQMVIHLGKNGKWYAGNQEIVDWLNEKTTEVIF